MPHHAHAVGVLDASGERFSQFQAGGMAAASSDVTFLVGGVILKLQPCYTGFLGENPVHLLEKQQ